MSFGELGEYRGMTARIIIIGGGATGLGVAYRLHELGYKSWKVFEGNSNIGGLAASFKDEKGFTWDMAGHVISSQHDYVDKLVDRLLGGEYLLHRRNSWIWVLNRWIPYPFQNNIRYLPRQKALECLLGLVKIQGNKDSYKNFEEWILDTFGEGIAKYFMLPYNRKLWAYPLELMDKSWAAERIGVVSIERVLKNVIYKQDDISWGNSQFKFPVYGGIGGLFSRFMPCLKGHLTVGEEVREIDIEKKVAKFSAGREVGYDILINTMPLDQLIYRLTPKPDFLVEAAKRLKHNSIFSVGIGIKKTCPSDKSWIYFPEDNCCFHRVTYLSNYCPNNVPDPAKYYSLLCETSYSDYKPEDKDKIIERTIEGLVNTRLISEADKGLIETIYLAQVDYAYPIPTLERDKALRVIQTYLQEKGLYSRGRFGAWKYEVGNIDHSIMQGVETVDKLLFDRTSNR